MISICPFLISICRKFSAALLILFLSVPAFGAQPLFYKSAEGWKEQRVLEDIAARFSQETDDLEGAQIDLNTDGVEEYIFRESGKKGLIPYYIYAVRRGKPVFLGRIEAHKIMPLSEKTYGVLNILVYNVPNNDFKAVTYQWNPYTFQYVDTN